jgi:hypothetical protein
MRLYVSYDDLSFTITQEQSPRQVATRAPEHFDASGSREHRGTAHPGRECSRRGCSTPHGRRYS